MSKTNIRCTEGKGIVMKKYDRMMLAVIVAFLIGICWMGSRYRNHSSALEHREYQVSIHRARHAVEAFEQERSRAPKNLGELRDWAGDREFPALTGLSVIPADAGRRERDDFLENESGEYAILATKSNYYKLTYQPGNMAILEIRMYSTGMMIGIFLFVLVLLCYIRQKILLPFHQFSEVPYELAKGNLTIPLQENKNRFFGKYIWGMDLLREHLEQNKVRELDLQKEKKMLFLSLGHDVKTPLSAIKLYAGAMSKGLYQAEGKEQEIAENIKRNVDVIERYLSEMIQASREDFLDFEVNNAEFYIRDTMEKVREYYQDKMSLNQIDFSVGVYPNCLLFGDADRFQEVLQNVIENAIKYGDGRRIWLEVRREEEEYQIILFNTGCSLSKKELPHIFDSFYRGSNVGERQGSGLGLYICRQLMHRMEGEITAEILEDAGERMMSVHIIFHLG